MEAWQHMAGKEQVIANQSIIVAIKSARIKIFQDNSLLAFSFSYWCYASY